VKYVDRLLVNKIVHHLDQVSISVKSNHGILVVMAFHEEIAKMRFNGPPYIVFGYVMLEPMD